MLQARNQQWFLSTPRTFDLILPNNLNIMIPGHGGSWQDHFCSGFNITQILNDQHIAHSTFLFKGNTSDSISNYPTNHFDSYSYCHSAAYQHYTRHKHPHHHPHLPNHCDSTLSTLFFHTSGWGTRQQQLDILGAIEQRYCCLLSGQSRLSTAPRPTPFAINNQDEHAFFYIRPSHVCSYLAR
jgi:hypothetical protein